MTRIALLFSLALLAGCAPDVFRADAGVAFPRLTGGASLQNSAGNASLSDVKNNIRGSLDVGQLQPQPYLRLESDWGPHRVRVHGFGYDESGSSLLDRDFGDLVSGTAVDSSLEYLNVVGSWSYDLMPTKTLRLGPGVQLGLYSLDMTARSSFPSGFEKVMTDVVMPQLFLDGGVDLGIVSADANIGFMSAHLGDAAGRYVDAELMLRARPAEQFEVFAGYRLTVLDVLGVASGRDFDADLTVSGVVLGGGVRF
ncbi:MAG: hypothetical protein Fur0037_06680 [Planctomycetota bacterium]